MKALTLKNKSEDTALAPYQEGSVKLSMPDGSGSISKFVVDNTVPAWENKKFLKGFGHMILVSRRSSKWANDHEYSMMQEAMKREKVTPVEVYNAFWKAFGDPYTPATGIEWKHLWKQIQQARENGYYPGKKMDQETLDALEAKQKQYS